MEMLDFNAVRQPTWPVKLKDEDQTVVNLSYPSLELAERLAAAGSELGKAVKKKDGATIQATFGAIAEVMSCNEDGFTFTAEELRDRYHMTLLDATRFVSGYVDFLQEAGSAKN